MHPIVSFRRGCGAHAVDDGIESMFAIAVMAGEGLNVDALERLGAIGFQDFAAALCVDLFGPVVHPMGVGSDGGRDLYSREPLRGGISGDVMWSGYTVFQVKHKATIAERGQANTTWLWDAIRSELLRWSEPGGDRDPLSDTLVFITNAPLSAKPKTGGHDVIRQHIANLKNATSQALLDASNGDHKEAAERSRRLAQIMRIEIWSRKMLSTQISARPSLRKGFRAFVTPGDVLADLSSWNDRVSLDELAGVLRTHARGSLVGDEGRVYFDEAGSDDTRGFPIHEVAIDLPVVDSFSQRRSALRFVLDRAERVLRPSQPFLMKRRHIVLTGAPGNGKSTLAKYIVQAFRAAMLSDANNMSDEQARAISGMTASLKKIGRDLPGNRRWPVLIDLAKYAESGDLERESTLTRAIADLVSRRLDAGSIRPSDLNTWLGQWPSIIVMDGLDEVSDPRTRRELLTQISTFASESEAADHDTLIVVTTRPTGYNGDIDPTMFDRIDLDYLTPEQALSYGLMVSEIRLINNSDRLEQLQTRFRQAVQDPNLQNLLRTPLQVLIVTIIIESARQLAPDRYGLFWGYYLAVLGRERNKAGHFGTLIRDNEPQITRLHQLVGLELQMRSESSEHANASLPMPELQNLAHRVLADDGFKPDSADAPLLRRMVTAATQRLVLIVPRDDGVGFDVRSLQEMLAARELTTGEPESVMNRLRLLAAGPHWRNTWIFAAGRIMNEPRDIEQRELVQLLESIDNDAPRRLGRVLPVGPAIALEILDDGMVRSRPKWRDRLLALALELIECGADTQRIGMGVPLLRLVNSDTSLVGSVAGALRTALAGGGAGAKVAAMFISMVGPTAESLSLGLRVRALAGIPIPPQSVAADERTYTDEFWAEYELEIETAPLSPERLQRLRTLAEQFRDAVRHDALASPALVSSLTHLLDDERSAAAMESALFHVKDGESVRTLLWLHFVPIVQGKPVAKMLSQMSNPNQPLSPITSDT